MRGLPGLQGCAAACQRRAPCLQRCLPAWVCPLIQQHRLCTTEHALTRGQHRSSATARLPDHSCCVQSLPVLQVMALSQHTYSRTAVLVDTVPPLRRARLHAGAALLILSLSTRLGCPHRQRPACCPPLWLSHCCLRSGCAWLPPGDPPPAIPAGACTFPPTVAGPHASVPSVMSTTGQTAVLPLPGTWKVPLLH